mgnify:CR=1 FL=1
MPIPNEIPVGARIVVRRKFSRSEFWRDIRAHGITFCQYVGEICRFLLSVPATGSDREHSLRKMAGTGLTPEIWQQWTSRFGAVFQIYEGWGGTESNTNTINLDNRIGSCGRVPYWEKTNFRLVRYDVESDTHPRDDRGFYLLCKPGEVGEGMGYIVNHRQIGGGRFEIIAGERRWRASQLAGQDKIPAMVRELPDEAAIAMALIENIQREDLNPIEEAVALQRLQQEFELTQQQVADAVGKSRVTITNLLRLIALPEEIKTLLAHGDLEMGHARALLALTGAVQTELARQVAQKGMTVRDTEKMVQRLLAPREERPAVEPPPLLASWESRVSERLGIPAKFVSSGKEKGKLVISFQNQADLDKILRYFELS